MKDVNQTKTTVLLHHAVDVVELCIAFVLVAGVLILLVQMIGEYGAAILRGGTFDFSDFLSQALTLIIGIEFTRMLCRHTPDTIIEVLMFAMARQLIVLHPSAWETFLGIVSLAVLFVVRRYLVSGNVEARPGLRFRGRKREPTHPHP